MMNYTYDPDDRLGSDQYDANGNTISAAGTTSTYDFENHLVSKGGVTIVYDGDGNRVSETVAGVTTQYLVDTQNPTGYAQVVDEMQNGAVTRTYSWGLELISKLETGNSKLSFYGYDGHGSVRLLTDSTGAVTDSYDYDAFGNLINSTGSTPNNYLFAGEQFDPALGLYYNRARYLNTTSARFWTEDAFEGDVQNPLSIHRYLYVEANPVNSTDPTGMFLLANAFYGDRVHRLIGADFELKTGGLSDTSVNEILDVNVFGGGIRPDLIDIAKHEIYEIKPDNGAAITLGYTQILAYLTLLNALDKSHWWKPGMSYMPPPLIPLNDEAAALVGPPAAGLITYNVLSFTETVALVYTAVAVSMAETQLDVGVAITNTASTGIVY